MAKNPLFRPVGRKQMRKVVHNLYARAGLLNKSTGRMYEPRVHTFEHFQTHPIVLGAPDYVRCLMGKTVLEKCA